MACRMHRYIHTIHVHRFFPFHRLEGLFAQTQLQQGFAMNMAKVFLHPQAGMIAVRMGDHSFVNRLPGINVKTSLPAVKPFIREFY
jgi:hypothetical protein